MVIAEKRTEKIKFSKNLCLEKESNLNYKTRNWELRKTNIILGWEALET